MKTGNFCICLILLMISFQACKKNRDNFINDLSGNWEFQIDSLDQGFTDNWVTKDFNDQIQLPGSMLTNGKGDEITAETRWTAGIWDSTWYKSPEFAKYRQPGNVKVSFFLQPLKYYVGVAWYRKKVTIPPGWKNRYTELFLERCHWESTVWVDNQKVGMQNALSAPHIYELSQWLTPGEHMLTIRIDNRIRDIDPGKDAHSLTDNTQTNWNGIIGKICLINRPPVYINRIQLYPDVDKKKVQALIEIRNISGKEADYQLVLSVTPVNAGLNPTSTRLSQFIHIEKDITVVDLIYPMGENPLLWDEFEPNLYTLKAEIRGEMGNDMCHTDFGMRKFEIRDTRFWMNGRPIFLRGTLECAIFPKTGFPSVNVEDWMHIFEKCKEYGLNHMRFHSWCPPEAAFIAADRMGIYLSIENSAWANLGGNAPIDQYIYDESNRIVRQFENHPSFCLMPYGNEASGDSASAYLTKFIRYWKVKDNRRFYTSASGFPSSAASDYTSSGAARIQWWDAGLSSPINANPPTSDYDWKHYIERDKPTVSHEIGQWCVYPDFREMNKYDGMLKPRNFEIFLERLKEHGLASLADSFLLASGKLQVLCYKADIEAAFRTPGFAGFQLLDLHDFPGQGTALVGVLNPFWEEKGYVGSKEYTRFCNSTVPLLRMKKMIFLNNEIFDAKAEICHYGRTPLENMAAIWKITGKNGKTLAEGKFPLMNVPFGITQLGEIKQELIIISKPEQLKVTITAGQYENSWDIWVFPAKPDIIHGEEQIKIVQVLDAEAIDYLNKGGKVLLTIKKGSIRKDKGGNVPVGFSSIFWNTQWTAFRQPPFTLGILCKPSHPALAEFPTDYYSNWQWWDAMSHCNAIRLDSVSPEIVPIVRIIDDWFTARPLGMIFECKVGKGKLMVSGADLLTERDKRPEARQLLYSLKNYMVSEQFNPKFTTDLEKIKSLMY